MESRNAYKILAWRPEGPEGGWENTWGWILRKQFMEMGMTEPRSWAVPHFYITLAQVLPDSSIEELID
jgi:hypothetical protein